MVISQDEDSRWTPTPADAWKDQEQSHPSWQRCQQQLPETVILCDNRSLMQISEGQCSTRSSATGDNGVVSGTARCVDRATHRGQRVCVLMRSKNNDQTSNFATTVQETVSQEFVPSPDSFAVKFTERAVNK